MPQIDASASRVKHNVERLPAVEIGRSVSGLETVFDDFVMRTKPPASRERTRGEWRSAEEQRGRQQDAEADSGREANGSDQKAAKHCAGGGGGHFLLVCHCLVRRVRLEPDLVAVPYVASGFSRTAAVVLSVVSGVSRPFFTPVERNSATRAICRMKTCYTKVSPPRARSSGG